MASDFGDFAPFIPHELAQVPLDTSTGCLDVAKSDMGADKSVMWREHKFLGLSANSPPCLIRCLLRILLPAGKILARSAINGKFSKARSTPLKQLKKLESRLASIQTSVCGRFGRPIIRPLRRKLRQRPDHEHFRPWRFGHSGLLGGIHSRRSPPCGPS